MAQWERGVGTWYGSSLFYCISPDSSVYPGSFTKFVE